MPTQKYVQEYSQEMGRNYMSKMCRNAPKEAAPNLKGIVDMSCKSPPAKKYASYNNTIKLEPLVQNFIHLSKHVWLQKLHEPRTAEYKVTASSM